MSDLSRTAFLREGNLTLARYKKLPSSAFKQGLPAPPVYTELDAAKDAVDACVVELERKWGMGRLLAVCRDQDLRRKMENTLREFNRALYDNDAKLAKQSGSGVIKGYSILEQHAKSIGAEPLTAGREMEATMKDGRVLVIVPSHDSWQKREDDKRDLCVMQISDIATILESKFEMVKEVATHFPGMTIERVRGVKDDPLNDEIPF